MASSSNNDLLRINEKLYNDLYFRLLHLKKNEPVNSNSITIVRDLLRQSKVHCNTQNMTELGVKQFKAELFTKCFNLVDHKNGENLLPVVNDVNKGFQMDEMGRHFMKSSLQKFTNSFSNIMSEQTKEYEMNKLNCETSQKIFNIVPNIHSPKSSSIPPLYPSGYNKVYDIPPLNSGYNRVRGGTIPPLNSPREGKVKDFSVKRNFQNKNEEFDRNHVKKKVCVQPQKSTSGSGFMSASSMYRNPFKPSGSATDSDSKCNLDPLSETNESSELRNHETLKHFDKKIVDVVLNEIMNFSPNIKWDDIAGLEFVKKTVQEIVIWPLLRPDIFTGLRAPPRGILLFGPPGTGKTLIGKCIATESNSTFFCISASSLASKWAGESEQMVRALFAVAKLNQPAVIFIDEIDSLLSQRSAKDQDFTRKIKTEFLVQFDGAKTSSEERVLVIGATNRPHELDEAARRRFVKRLFVPLPDQSARKQIIQQLLKTHEHNLSDEDLQKICNETEGYSGSDVSHLCKEAAMGPIRCIGPENIKTVTLDKVRPISLCDFTDALRQVRASVVADDMNYYIEWNKKFGSFGIQS